MVKPNKSCCFPLHEKKLCSAGPLRRGHSLFFRIFLLLLCTVTVATIIHVITGKHDGQHEHGVAHTLFWLITVVLAGSIVLRILFEPLRRIMRGVQALSDGNLDYRVRECGPGELKRISAAFNYMVEKIQDMLHAKTQLLLDVSHELRSPLTRIKIALEMSPNTAHKESIMQDIAEMEAMLTELLESAALKNGNGNLDIIDVDMVSVVRDVMCKYESQLPGLKLKKCPEHLVISADKTKLRRVLQNVIENALKYSAKVEQPVEISIESINDQAIVTIKDFGEGIEESEQMRIFEPFYRVDKSRNRKSGGYGLGLSLCKEIMRAHKGDIVLSSAPGQGTEIQLVFPMAAKA